MEYALNYAKDNNIRIINHSLVVPNTNFYDGECWSFSGLPNAVCSANNAYGNNILWVNAAGNQAQKHYWADFNDSDGDDWHNISPSDETINISVNAGDKIKVYLTWDAWNDELTTDQDYDLFLYNSSNIEVANSTNTQAGGALQIPTEEIVFSAPADGPYYLKILKYSATSNHRLQIYSINHRLTPAKADRSLLSPADAVGAMAVGAIDQDIWAEVGATQEPYSSKGPTNDGRIKPDIMGPDNVSTDVYNTGFTGTSASLRYNCQKNQTNIPPIPIIAVRSIHEK